MTQGPCKTAHDYDQELLALFDAYVHGDIDRRRFLERAAKFAVGSVTAAMLLDELSPDFVHALVLPPDDARVFSERVEISSTAGHGPVRAYFVLPAAGPAELPGVLVIHENRGLNPHPRINDSWPAFEAALQAAGVAYEYHLYPGTQHGFHNDTTPRYDAAAAKPAWDRTVAFFERHLGKAMPGEPAPTPPPNT